MNSLSLEGGRRGEGRDGGREGSDDCYRGDWGPLGHFSYFVKYLDFEKQYACVTYHNLLTIHSAT